MLKILLVFAGGGAGSLVRYGCNVWLKPISVSFPYTTLTANVLSCFILGALYSRQMRDPSENLWLLVATGFCGGFSTFSSFALDTWKLQQDSGLGLATGNIIANLTVCFIALIIGISVRW